MSETKNPNEYFEKIINEQNKTIAELAKKIQGLTTEKEVKSPETQVNNSQPSTSEISLSETFKNIYQKMKEAK